MARSWMMTAMLAQGQSMSAGQTRYRRGIEAVRIGDNFSPKKKVVVAFPTLLGLALNLVLAISPLWGWHPFLGWASSAVLFAFFWDARLSVRVALGSQATTADWLLLSRDPWCGSACQRWRCNIY